MTYSRRDDQKQSYLPRVEHGAVSQSPHLRNPVLSLQRQYGNRYVQRLFAGEAKLTNPVIQGQADEGNADGQPPTATAGGGQPDLQIINPGVIPSLAIVHATDSFDVQWVTGNLGTAASQPFKDRLQVFKVSDDTNQCPGSDADLGDAIYDSDNDSNVNLQEGPIAPLQRGPLMEGTVGPFTSGSYRLTVTVNSDFGERNESNTDNNSSFNCINIEPASGTQESET